jgi:hypothetical protein
VTKNPFARAVPAVLLGAALSASAFAPLALADVKDYRFELVQQEAKVGEAVIAVRLVDQRRRWRRSPARWRR